MHRIDLQEKKLRIDFNRFKAVIYIVTAILFVLSVFFNMKYQAELAGKNILLHEKNLQIEVEKENYDSLKQHYADLDNLIDTNRRLYQLMVACKYKHLPATKENIQKFVVEAKVLEPEMNYGVAQKETGFRAGTAKYNNLHGFKRANNRFTWSLGKKTQNNSFYKHWAFSCLDFDEYLRKGNENWSAYAKGFK